MQFWKTDKFKKLNDAWKKKLEKSGFVDCEQDENYLKQFSGNFAKNQESNKSRAVIEGKLQYYSMCRQFLVTHKFKNKLHRKVFELHCEGLGVRKIAERVGTYFNRVQGILKPLKDKVKEKR